MPSWIATQVQWHARATPETVDGMSLEKINTIIDALKHERYKWTPVRRTYIPKKNGRLRPLGMPSESDKLLQEVIRSILEAYYEPQFNQHSHGFRPKRGCHTALKEITQKGRATKWFIEGDISACFDRIDHTILLNILLDKIHHNRFIRLIKGLLDAGYLENWKYNSTYSGVPQGAVVSPILANLVLDKLDKYVEQELIPAHTRGQRRSVYPPYRELTLICVKSPKSWKIGRSTETEPTGTVHSIPRPQWSKLSSPLVDKVRFGFPVRGSRLKIRSIGYQTENRHVFTWWIKTVTRVMKRRSLLMLATKLLNFWVTTSMYYTPTINMTIVVKDVSMVVWDWGFPKA